MSFQIQNNPKGNHNLTSYNSDTRKHFYQNSVDWSLLPSIALENVYTYLSKTDQINMSLVCKNWSHEFGSPGLWKKITYNVFRRTQNETWPEIEIARKFGCMFRYVEITGNIFVRDEVNKAKEQFQLFLEVLSGSNCKLVSLIFKNTHKLHQFLSNTSSENFVNYTTSFIRTQNTLRTVEFYKSYYRKEEAVKILLAVCESNSKTLKTLVLKGFTRDRYAGVDIPISPHVLLIYDFINLTTLRVDYSQFFEENMQLLLKLNDMQIRSLKNLTLIDIECQGSKIAPIRGISPAVWKRLRTLCPQLRINLNLNYSSQIRNEFSVYLVNYMPLQYLECNLAVQPDPDINIGDLFQQIYNCHAFDFLESIRIVWMPLIEDISIYLIPFLQIAKKLKALQMYFRHPVVGFVAVFEYLLEYRPESLESIYISITEVYDDNDYMQLMTAADEYIPLLQIIGLNVIFLADLGVDDDEF